MLSIIVPVYNCESSLDKCITSILGQSYKDFELILVNDGSGDNSGQICDKYANTDERISCVHKENGGVSSARNAGIERAKGEYVQFVDADDYIENDMCERLMEYAGEYDWVICGYNIISREKAQPMLPEEGEGGVNDLDTVITELFSRWFINSPCNKLYRKALIKKAFNTKYQLGEDLLFNLEYAKEAKSFKSINNALYNYVRDDKESLTKRRDDIDCIKEVYKRSMDFYENNCKNPKTKQDIAEIYVDHFISIIEANMNNDALAEKLLTDDATKDAFEVYLPPSRMQKLFKCLVLKGKYKAVKRYLIFRKKMK